MNFEEPSYGHWCMNDSRQCGGVKEFSFRIPTRAPLDQSIYALAHTLFERAIQRERQRGILMRRKVRRQDMRRKDENLHKEKKLDNKLTIQTYVLRK